MALSPAVVTGTVNITATLAIECMCETGTTKVSGRHACDTCATPSVEVGVTGPPGGPTGRASSGSTLSGTNAAGVPHVGGTSGGTLDGTASGVGGGLGDGIGGGILTRITSR